MTHPILNSFKGSDLAVTELVDRKRIEFLLENMADQINGSRNKFAGHVAATPKRVKDLSNYIADIIIETSVQGASFLEVHIIDPAWTLFQRDNKGVCFIDTDDEGYLWPPIEVNFPPNITDSRWRLCMCKPSTDLNAPNVVLTFEDVTASRLRETSKQMKSGPTETRAEFIQRLVKWANDHPEYPGQPKIRFVHLLPDSTFTEADLGMQGSPPPSTQVPKPAPARQDHTKGKSLKSIIGKNKNPFTNPLAPIAHTAPFGSGNNGPEISIGAGVEQILHSLGDPSTFGPPPSLVGFLEGNSPLP